MHQRTWSRRTILRTALTATAAAAVGPLLAACQSATATPTPAATAAAQPARATTATTVAASSPTAAASPAASATSAPAVVRSRTLKMRVALATEEAGNFIAVEKGFFREAGLNVDLVTTQGTPGEVIPLVAVGQLDLFSGAIQAALVNARTQGVAVTIVAGEGALRRGNVFHTYAVSQKLASQVRSIADLRGHTLAMPSDAGIDLLELQKVLATGNLTLDDVRLQLIRLPDMPVALQNGAVDAAELVEPYATIALQQLKAGAPVLPSDKIVDIVGDNFPISVIVAGPPMLNDPALLEAFLAGYLKGVRYYLQALQDSAARAEVVQILKNRTPLKDDALYAQMTWPGVSPDGTFDTAKLDEAQQLWKARGKIQQVVPSSQLVDFRYVQAAAKQVS